MLEAKEESGGEKIDNEDIQAQSLVFLFGGYETTSTTLAFACYHLALDGQVQDQLRDEIDRMWPGDEVGLSVISWFALKMVKCLSCYAEDKIKRVGQDFQWRNNIIGYYEKV